MLSKDPGSSPNYFIRRQWKTGYYFKSLETKSYKKGRSVTTRETRGAAVAAPLCACARYDFLLLGTDAIWRIETFDNAPKYGKYTALTPQLH